MSTNVSTLRAGASALLPIYPTSFDDVVRLARMSIIAGMIKPQKTGWGDNQETEDANATEARATMIILQGMELGIPPMQAVQLLAMINGRIVAHSEAVPGLLLSKGFKIKNQWFGTEMADDWGVTCKITRPDGEEFEGVFSVTKAKRAKLWSPDEKITKKGKNNTTYQADNDGSWHKYPDRMLWARALGFAAKDGAADALKGLMVREEMEDMIRSEHARDITPKAEPLSIPDIPDKEPDTPPTQPVETVEHEPDEIADPDGFLVKLKDDIEFCTSAEELAEVADANSDMISRLPKAQKIKASRMLKEAAE